MKTKELPIQFQINGIKTDEFAIIEEVFNENNKNIQYSLETKFGIPQNEVVVCAVGFKFIQDNIPFLKVKASCYFKIKKESWKSAMDSENNSIVFSTFFTDHLVMLTLGTVRGILHVKTEGTKFNRFFIPTINITELRNDETNFSLSLGDIPIHSFQTID